MRILLSADPELLVPPRLYGGIERIVAVLAEEFRKEGHVVGLVANGRSGANVDALYPWPGMKSQRFVDTVRNSVRLLSAARAFRPDVIQSFSRALYLCPILVRRQRVVMSYQRRPGSRQVSTIARVGGRSLIFTGCSEYIASVGRAAGGSWRAIHNCVDPHAYEAEFEARTDAPLAFLSRVEPIKGAHIAIEIARRSGRRLLIAGNHAVTGEEGRYWSEQIAPQFDDQIRYVGEVDDTQKNQLLREAAALVVPIQWDEPFGIVFVEALACGTPVISSPRGALPEIIENGRHGFLVESVDGGVAAVRRLGEIDRVACRERFETHFSSPIVARQYLDLYRQHVLGVAAP